MERQVLDSWKEISAYLGRSEVTCRRLEQELGLPVHRLEDSPKARVFAYKDEIDLWIEKTQHSKKKTSLGILGQRKLIIPVLAIIALAIGAVVIWQILRPEKEIIPLSQRPTVAVISFENQTGDNSLDYFSKVIPNLLITSLEQSEHLYVTTWERLNDLLKQVGKENLEFIDEDLGFKLCQMDEVDAIVMGSVAKAGEMFVTDAKVFDVKTKRILKSASSRGKGVESILRSQIDELSREISQSIGISEAQTRETPMRIADLTTNSVDAYDFFIRGREYLYSRNYKDARKFFEKAIDLDPNFAMAHLHLAATLRYSGESKAAVEAFKRAKDSSKRANEKERLYIEGAYARIIEKDWEKSFLIFNEMVKHYPKEKQSFYGLGLTYFYQGLFNQAIEEFNRALELGPYDVKTLNALAVSYWRLRDYEKAIEYFKKEISLSPKNTGTHRSMALVYFDMGKVDEALIKYKEAIEAGLELGFDWIISYVYAFKEDYPEALRWIDHYIDTTNPGVKGWGNFVKSYYLYWTGSLDKSMSNLLRMVEDADRTGEQQNKANAHWMMGWISLDREEFGSCRMYFKSWFDIYMQEVLPERPNPEARKKHWTAWYYFYLGLEDLKQEKIESAKSRMAEMNSLIPDVLPEYKKWIEFYYNYLQAEIFLAEGAVDKAITLLEKASPLGRIVEHRKLILHNVPFLKDVLARAYRQKGEIDKAIAEYERLIVFNPQREERYLIHPKCYYRLAELYEQKVDIAQAIQNYEKFLDLWEDADPGIAEVADAKERLAGLKNQ